MGKPEYVDCPVCGGGDVIAITLAYHKIQSDYGQAIMEHYDWSDEVSVECRDCGWGVGPGNTALTSQMELLPLTDIFHPATL